MIFIGIIANQIIDISVKPSIIVIEPTVEGTAVFRFKNNNPKTVQMYYKSDYDTEWISRNTASGAYFDITYEGEPGEIINVQAYSRAFEEDASEIVENSTIFFLPPVTANPTVAYIPTTKSGEAYFSIKNNEPGNVQIFYKLSTDTTWNSDYYVNEGGTLYLTITGTPGTNITLQVYAVGIYQTMKASSIIETSGSYYKATTIAPLIENVNTTISGYVKFKFTNQDASAGKLYYKIGDEITWSNTDLGIGGSFEVGWSGTPDEEVTVYAYFSVYNQYISSVVSKTGKYAPYQKTNAPLIEILQNNEPSKIIFNVKNVDDKGAIIYIKRSIDATWSQKYVNSMSYYDTAGVYYTGTPGESVTLQAYAVADGKIASDITEVTTSYYKPTTANPSFGYAYEYETPFGGAYRVEVTILNNDNTTATIYCRKSGGSWKSQTVSPNSYSSNFNLGASLPGETVTVEFYAVGTNKNASSTITKNIVVKGV